VTHVKIADVEVSYGRVPALRGVSLDIDPGEFVAVLGPSGCGKTTLLRAIAGFVDYTGSINVGGVSFDNVPPHKRNLGIVFQDYALFPHKTVTNNIAFGLRMRKQTDRLITEKVSSLVKLLHLDGLGERYPDALSGGQLQRVALARALAIDPMVLLLDEPLSALDKKLREDMQIELRKIQTRVGITTIFVTHDQEEALALADKIVVMNRGEVSQVGSPADIYQKPADSFIAGFIGKSNIFRGQISKVTTNWIICTVLDGESVRFSVDNASNYSIGAEVTLMVRPENLKIEKARSSNCTANRVAGSIEHITYLGDRCHVRVLLDNDIVVDVVEQTSHNRVLGEPVQISWSETDSVLIPNHEPSK